MKILEIDLMIFNQQSNGIMKMENKILSLKEMQDLFCDYVFKKLSDEEMKAFEDSLVKYPDLQKELDEVNVAFNKLQQKKLDKKISAYTRNLSVKVNQKLYERTGFGFKFQKLGNYLIPAAGLVTILLIVSYFYLFDTDNNNLQYRTKHKTFTGLTENDIKSLYKDGKTEINYLAEFQELIPVSSQYHSDLLAELDEKKVVSALTELYDNVLSEQILEDAVTFTKFESSKQYELFDKLEKLEEKDIENILKELENADFNS